MEWLDKVVQTFAGYAVRWRTRGGLFRIGAVLLLISWQIQSALKLPVTWLFVAAPLIALLWLVAWLIGSGRLPIPRGGKTIVLAIDLEVEVERNFGRIFQSLVTTIADLQLSQPMRLRRIDPAVVQTTSRAEWYLKNFHVAEVIWGRALAGKASNRQIQKFEVHWLWWLPSDSKQTAEAVLADLKLLEHGRTWTIEEVNELVDVEVLAEDFLEMSLAIIGILLLMEGSLQDAAAVFRRVVVGLQKHARPGLATKVARFREILHSTEFSLAFEAHERGHHKKAVEILERLLPSYPQDFEYRTTLARAYFLAGDTQAARRCTDELSRLDQSSPVVYVNRAFFCILDKKYKRAGEWYEKLMRSRREKLGVLSSVSEFLEEQYEEHPDEHAYLYGLAIVNGLLDEAVLDKDLTRFLDVTAGGTEYAPLRASAEALLKRSRT